MKVLVIMRNAWDDTNAIGNTLSNFFRGVDDLEFAALYFRSSMPNNSLCKRYYRTSEVEILRRWFQPAKIGKQFCLSDNAVGNEQIADGKNAVNEKKAIRMIQKHGIKLAYKLSDYLWYSKKWINDNLDDFITSFAPDLMVTFVKSSPQYYLTIRHLREKHRIPLFSWIADDEYTELLKKNGHKEIYNLQYILKESAMVRGCSEQLCAYYNAVFGCNAEPLYKSCDLSIPINKKVNKPITIVYAGNLLYGRLEIISQIADILETLFPNGTEVILEVYSNTALLPTDEKKFFAPKYCVRYMGRRDYGYIKERLASADIVLHVESFERDQLLKTKYSFSTKIIDCLQSGSVVLAVGPAEQASMAYISKIPGTCVINRQEELEVRLTELLQDTSGFVQRAEAIRRYAIQYHSPSVAAYNLREIMNKTIAGET